MFKLVRIIILFGVVFGAVFGLVYGLVRSAKKARKERLDREKKEALARLKALAQAQERGELSDKEAEELTWQVYLDAKDKGLDLTKEADEVRKGAVERVEEKELADR